MKDIAKTAASIGLMTVIALCSTGCATNAATGKQDLMLVSTEEETKLAGEEHQRFVSSPGLYSDKELQDYVQQVGNKIVAASDRKDIEYQFFVLNQSEVNAFALPNGHIYITRGLLAYLGTEAELAAVLAHEVAHVAARHSAQLMSGAKVAGAVSTAIGVLAGAAVGAATGDYNLAMSMMDATSGLSAVTGMLVLGNYSREHEMEADQLGGRYMSRTGYPQQAMVGVLDTLKSIEKFDAARLAKSDKKRQLYHQIATHPELEERIEKVEVAAEVAQAQSADLQAAYLEETAELVFEAFDETNPTQNRKDIWLNREALFQIYLPPDWKIVESSKETVSLEKPEAQLSTMFRLLPPQSDHDPMKIFSSEHVGAAAINDLKNLNPVHLKVPAFSAIADLKTAEGSRVAYVAVLFHDKHTVLMTGTPKDAVWLKTHRYVFDAQANLAKLLTQEEYDQQRVKRLRIVKAQSGDTYAALAKQSPLGAASENYLRLLNRQYPVGEPVVDQSIKIVVADP